MLTTVESHHSVSARFTDPTLKPSWRGRRFKFLCQKPTNDALWSDYLDLRQRDLRHGTFLAGEFYVANRAAMDAGAVVGNPHRYFDGEISALQSYFNTVARVGWEATRTELDNEPPIEELPTDDGLVAHRIQRQLSGVPHRVVPANCGVLTRGIDINKRLAHWVVRAFAPDGTCFTIDYGVQEVFGVRGSDDGLEEAIEKALLDLFEQEETAPYSYEDGSPCSIKATYIDSRFQTGAVRQAVKKANELWGSRFYTVMGCGKSGRCAKTSYREVLNNHNPDRKTGDGYHLDRITGICWECKIDKERFVRYEHSRWLAVGPAANYLYGENSPDPDAIHMNDVEKGHQSYAKHIVNEKEIEELYKGQIRRVWKASNAVHFLDASCYATAAALKEGVLLPSFALHRGPKKMADPNFFAKAMGGQT